MLVHILESNSVNFSCGLRCVAFIINYFIVTDLLQDNPELITATVKASKASADGASSKPIASSSSKKIVESNAPSLSGAEQWIVHAIQSYQVKLQSLSKSELRDEVLRCNRKNFLTHGKKAVKLNVGGSVTELIERLSAEALRVLTGRCDSGNASDTEKEDTLMELSDNDEGDSEDDDLVICEETVSCPKAKSAKKIVISDSEDAMSESQEEFPTESEDDSSSFSKRRNSKKRVRARPTSMEALDDEYLSDADSQYDQDDELSATLRKTFGFTSFREGQRYFV